MLQLTTVLNAWGTPAFAETFKKAIVQMDAALLPLQQGLSQSSYTDGAGRSVMILSMTDWKKAKASPAPAGVQGFIVALPIQWTAGENNDSKLSLTLLAEIQEGSDRLGLTAGQATAQG